MRIADLSFFHILSKGLSMNVLEQLESFCNSDSAVSFREFITSPDYCNYPDMYDWWLDEVDKLPRKCNELILDGSIGSGKSTVSAYYMAYRVYLLFHDGTPHTKLGIPENSDIYVCYFSVSLDTAKASGFALLYSIFEDSPWFKEHTPINNKLKSTIEFVGRHFYIKFASDFAHQLSLNVWGFILDEANFKKGVGEGTVTEYAEVTELYGQLLDRQTSRFASADGVQDTLAILVSSASYQSSFSEQRKQAIKKSPNAKALTGIKYLLSPERYSKTKFKVFIGCGTTEACIIENDEQYEMVMRGANLLGTGQEQDFIREVPDNLRSMFEYNIVRALQNHCGVPTSMSSGFMPNMKCLYDSYVTNLPQVLQSYTLEASTGDDTELNEYLLSENFEHVDRPHSMYLDLSVQHDTCALVLYRYDGKLGDLDIHTRVFSLKIKPPHYPNQTSVRKVKQFVLDIAQIVNLVAFASDQYQSTQLRQEIREELGLDDIRISLDSTDVPHMHWIRALVEHRITQLEDDTLTEECKTQVHDWKKHRVVKAEGGSDDVFQANIGAFFLSDTIGAKMGTCDDLFDDGRANLVSSARLNKMLAQLGYK